MRPAVRRVILAEAVPDVAGRAPEVARVLRPQPWLGGAPLAHRKDDRATALSERVGHHRIGFLGVAVARIAPVILQIINAPAGIADGVLILVSLASGTPAAGQPSRIRIDAKLEPPRMNVIRERLDTGWEFPCVGHDEAVRVPRTLPAVVNHHILVAGI